MRRRIRTLQRWQGNSWAARHRLRLWNVSLVSVAGQFFDDLRRQLDDEKLEELMWAAINKGNRRQE
jgi:hypothetical protein